MGVFTAEIFWCLILRFKKIFYFWSVFSYYTDSDVFLAESVDLADISDFFADIFTFHRDWFWSLNITIFRLRRAAAEAAVKRASARGRSRCAAEAKNRDI